MRAIAVSLALCMASAAQAAPPERLTGPAASPFYEWSGAAPAPGAILRREALPAEFALANAATSERILYSSTDGIDGKTPRAVSGALFRPKGEPPAGGWPIVAWAHGTVGAAAKCAPSFRGRAERDKTYLNAWLAAGFAVVATDYQGLGTAGGHPYLATRPEAYGVLDAVRAVRGKDGIGEKTVIVGQSQGGGAAFATAAFQPAYAPDVKLAATVATGVPYFSPATAAALTNGALSDQVSNTIVYSFLLMQLAELTRGFDPAPFLTPEGRAIYDLGATTCYGGMEEAVTKGAVSEKVAFTKPVSPVLQAIFPLIVYPTVKLEQPLFVGTGDADHDVPPLMQGALVKDACAAGSRVMWRTYAGLDHSAVVNASLADSLPFVKGLLAGGAAPQACDIGPGTK
jgi:pimeloyl-ACP methyl ester carboxylesterase